MKGELYIRLQKLIGEHKINLMSPIGLLDISAATIETVKAYKIATATWKNQDILSFDHVSGVLRNSR